MFICLATSGRNWSFLGVDEQHKIHSLIGVEALEVFFSFFSRVVKNYLTISFSKAEASLSLFQFVCEFPTSVFAYKEREKMDGCENEIKKRRVN